MEGVDEEWRGGWMMKGEVENRWAGGGGRMMENIDKGTLQSHKKLKIRVLMIFFLTFLNDFE